jgi:hypothetical protein
VVKGPWKTIVSCVAMWKQPPLNEWFAKVRHKLRWEESLKYLSDIRSGYQTTMKKGKAIPVTGRGGTQVCETSRFPHFLDNRLTDGSKVSCRPLPPGRFLVPFSVRD